MVARIVVETPSRSIAAIEISQALFTPPFRGELFPCLIWDHTGQLSESERHAVAGTLLDAGCRYAVCGGTHCEEWHTAFDLEFVVRHLNDPEDVVDAVHVMTTSHEGEAPDDVAFFFVMNTNFDYHSFNKYLIVHIGTGPVHDRLEAAVRMYASSGPAV